jgi:uncharacterized protein (DUF1015 family)
VAEIASLRGIRFDRARSGPVGPLLAPPYDVAMAQGTGGELSISGIENVDFGVTGDQHALASRRYHEWLSNGILHRDAAPAMYVHRHTFLIEGEETTRTGIIARVRLRDWDDRIILPHEGTFPGPRAERLARLRAVNANLSPLYFLCRDPKRDLRTLLDKAIGKHAAPVEHDRMGGSHVLTPIFEPSFQRRLAEFFASQTLFVADGHHRYEAALAFRDEQRKHRRDKDGPWNYVLALIAAVEDPGVIVRPTQRLIKGDAIAPRPLLELLSRWFSVEEEGPFGNEEREKVLFRLMLPDSTQAWVVRVKPGSPHQALMPNTRGVTWRSLSISAVDGVLQSLFGSGMASTGRQVVPIVDARSAVAQVHDGTASAAFLLPPPSLESLFSVAEEGDRLPPKSTWFEPKAPAGLVINDLELTAAE